ncbi:MAG: SRPBCC domain-containing protein [Thermoleophilia bacterium]|nr:SRPBCC domain-containing protein [Thermoleophilia bacterium]
MSDDDFDLILEREFDAPRAAVYRAFLDPDQLAAWFGPETVHVPLESVDIEASVGGHQRFDMVLNDDPRRRFATDAVFTELVENEVIASEETFDMGDGPVAMRARIEFRDAGPGRTRLTIRQGPHGGMLSGARAGWGSSFTKLDALLAGRDA